MFETEDFGTGAPRLSSEQQEERLRAQAANVKEIVRWLQRIGLSLADEKQV